MMTLVESGITKIHIDTSCQSLIENDKKQQQKQKKPQMTNSSPGRASVESGEKKMLSKLEPRCSERFPRVSGKDLKRWDFCGVGGWDMFK